MRRRGWIGDRRKVRDKNMATESHSAFTQVTLIPAVALLIVDDDPASRDSLVDALAQPGLEIFTASSADEALEIFSRRKPQMVLIDTKKMTLSGIDAMERMIEAEPATDAILMSEHDEAVGAEAATRSGSSFLTTPVSLQDLRERVEKGIEEARLRQLRNAGEDLPGDAEFHGMIGQSPRMREVFSRIRRVAPHYRSMLITGETGTGKDLVASAVHALSPGAAGRFVVLNCSAVVETLFESELFGHARGSFTGATNDKPGLFEHADGGTLFLDEIGDMPLFTQAKLLRVLQNQQVQRVGALNTRQVSVRVIAATNHDLRGLIADRRFREDLYYRLSMVEIQVPRLAERKEDMLLLQRHFISRFAAEYKKEVLGLTYRAEMRLLQHSWPGNVRELENVIGHAAMMTTRNTIDVAALPLYLSAPLADHCGPIPLKLPVVRSRKWNVNTSYASFRLPVG